MRALLLALLCYAMPAFAITVEQPLPSSEQEAAAQAIFRELKCVVCEGQALAESDAALAHQMRELVRTQVKEGKSKEEVLQYFTERYGNQVRLTPPLQQSTLLLWLAPLMLVAFGIALALRQVRR